MAPLPLDALDLLSLEALLSEVLSLGLLLVLELLFLELASSLS